MQRQLTLLVAFALIAIAGALPLAAMLVRSVWVDGALSLSAYVKVFAASSQYLGSLARTSSLALSVTLIAVSLGVALGVLFAKTDLPLRGTLAVLLAAPLCLPPYVLALSWSSLLGRGGLFPSEWSNWFYGLPGCVWIMVSALMPIVMIVTIIAVRAVDPRLEEAGRLIARWPAVLRHITLPLLYPALLLVVLIVFLLAAGEVAVPMLLHYPVYPLTTLVQFAAFYDFPAASATAVPLLALAALLVLAEQRSFPDAAWRLLTATARPTLRVSLQRWRIPALLATGLLAALLAGLPLAALLRASLDPFGYIQAWRAIGDSVMRSLAYGIVGASALTALGFACGYLIQRRATRWWRTADVLTLVLFTVPGTVLGVGLIALWNHAATALLYASSLTLILAYVGQYSALTTRITAAVLAGVPTTLEDAARVCGAPWFARLRFVVIPPVLPGLAAAWLVGFIFCLRDLGASMLVYPPGAEPLTVRIFTLMANGSPSMIAAACVTLVGINLVMLSVLAAIFRISAHHR